MVTWIYMFNDNTHTPSYHVNEKSKDIFYDTTRQFSANTHIYIQNYITSGQTMQDFIHKWNLEVELGRVPRLIRNDKDHAWKWILFDEIRPFEWMRVMFDLRSGYSQYIQRYTEMSTVRAGTENGLDCRGFSFSLTNNSNNKNVLANGKVSGLRQYVENPCVTYTSNPIYSCADTATKSERPIFRFRVRPPPAAAPSSC